MMTSVDFSTPTTEATSLFLVANQYQLKSEPHAAELHAGFEDAFAFDVRSTDKGTFWVKYRV
jgi:hypothetical protein